MDKNKFHVVFVNAQMEGIMIEAVYNQKGEMTGFKEIK